MQADIQPAAQRTLKGEVCNTSACKILGFFSQTKVCYLQALETFKNVHKQMMKATQNTPH